MFLFLTAQKYLALMGKDDSEVRHVQISGLKIVKNETTTFKAVTEPKEGW